MIIATRVYPCIVSFCVFLLTFGLCLLLWESFGTLCGADKQNKNSLIVAQIYTRSTPGENAKTSGPTEQQEKKKKKKRRFMFVWIIWAQQERCEQEGEGIKMKPACSPQANIVYAAVHANSMNIL